MGVVTAMKRNLGKKSLASPRASRIHRRSLFPMSRTRVPQAAAGAPKRSYDVFISFKNTDPSGGATEDSIWARKVYSALKAEGIRVFFSEVELQRLGAGHFAEAIDAALDSCRIMVVVSSCREHVESKYVAFEWRTFLNDMRGGRKEGELFILNCGDLRAQDLPIGLRLHQVFRTGDLAKLTRSVQNALPARRKLGDLVHASLHCHDPKKGEDKVYVVTIREYEIGYCVEAHWGPRMARRLVSQLKGVGISERQEAERLADRLVQSKRSSGYIPRGVVQLLTRDARKLLEMRLGLKGPLRRGSAVRGGGFTGLGTTERPDGLQLVGSIQILSLIHI